MNEPFHKRIGWLVIAALILLTLVAFWGVKDLDFVNYDDHLYVRDNPDLEAGLSLPGLRWAFSSPDGANWIPLSLVTYLVDYEIGGRNPQVYHVTSLIFHMANVVLLYWVLQRMSGAVWPSAFVAALFAVHPLRVESVAWVAERKDLISGLFWMLTILAYVRYRERPGAGRYLVVCLGLAAGLMAKAMVVTLPCVLLLLDYWPLGRLNGEPCTYRALAARWWPLLREKLPLFALSAVVAVMTAIMQQHAGAVGSLENCPIGVRMGNACLAYVAYIGKMFWPTRLAVLYPHPGRALPMTQVAGSAMLLVAISLGSFWLRRRYPHMIVGWLWYVGTLVPMIGIVQVGEQAMADRYTYLPIVGLFIVLAWTVPALLTHWNHQRRALAVCACAVLVALVGVTRRQATYWRDSVTLWEHALSVTRNNFRAQNTLGSALLEEDRYAEAAPHFAQALRFRPDDAEAHYALGHCLLNLGQTAQAAEHFAEVLRLDPAHVNAHVDWGVVSGGQGDIDEAIAHLRRALELEPDNADAHYNLGAAFALLGKRDEAAEHFSAVLRIQPGDPEAQQALSALDD